MIRRALEDTLNRHRAFWNREDTDRPCIGFTTARYFCREEFASISIPTDRCLTPEDFEVEAFLGEYDRQYRESQEMAGDQVWGSLPFFGLSWMEAIVGCAIRADEQALWNEPFVGDIRGVPDLRLSPDNPWLQKLLEFTTKLVAQADGRYPVGVPFMSGPLDILTAMRGPVGGLLDFFDHPDEVRKVIDALVDVWLEVAQAQFNLIPEFHGGYCGAFRGVWAPGISLETQEDAMGLISPELFCEFLLPAHHRIISSFDFPSLHIHSSYLQHIDTIAAISELPAVEFTIDVDGPPAVELIPVIANIQSQKPTIIHGKLTMQEMNELMHSLPPEGLWLITRVESPQVANQMFETLLSDY